MSVAAAAENRNLLRNSGFEKIGSIGLESASVPGWTIRGRKKGVVLQDCAEDMFGTKSLKIRFLALPKEGDWEICQDIPGTSFKRDSDFRFTGWMNCYKGSSAFKIRLLRKGTVAEELTLDAWDGSGEYDSAGHWLQYSTVFNSGKSDGMQIACVLKNDRQFLRDTAWFDGLEVVPDGDPGKAGPDAGPFPKEIHVSAQAGPDGDGSRARPFATLQAALDRAGPGTTVKLGAGVYTENVLFKRGGSEREPLILEGGPDVLMQGAEPVVLKWEKVEDWGEGVYRTRSPLGFIRGIYVNTKRSSEGRKLPLVRYERTGKGRGTWYHRNLFKVGVMTDQKKPGQGFEVLKAVAMYHPEDQCIYVRFGDNQDPNTLRFRLVKGTALLDVESVRNVVIRDLTLTCSVKGVTIRRSENITVQDCRFRAVEYGVSVRFSRSIKVSNNRLTLDAYHVMNPHRMVVRTPQGPRYQSDIWRAFKWAGYYDRCGILLRGAEDCEISGNSIQDHWDGIAAYGRRNPNIKVHHNHIENICDDGLTVIGDAGQEWYCNTVVNCFASLRYYHNTHSKGPVYIYGNYLAHGRQDNIRFMNDTDMRIYVYHNTMKGGDGIRYHGNKQSGTPNTYVYNNRFLANFYGMTSKVRRAKVVPNFKAGYNTYLSDRHDVIRKYGLNEHGYLGMDNTGKGADLSRLFANPLPGCPPGYFTGNKPDCGAEALGVGTQERR